MDVVLVPGFWLRADSWTEVLPALQAAGHTTHPITRPGLGVGDDPSRVTLADQVAAVIAAIDRASAAPVALVAHSGGGPMAYAAAAERLERVARIVYVDTWPLPAGMAINEELPVEGDAIPLPDWAVFDDADLRDLDADARARFHALAAPEPASSALEGQPEVDARVRAIPSTVIASSHTPEEFQQYLDSPFFAELKAVESVDWVSLPTGHWPQLTRPRELGEAIVGALGPSALTPPDDQA